jgi:large subunit ribosomal protein L25
LVLQRQLRDISVECLPGDIPTEFEVDVSHLNLGDTVLAGELQVPEGVKIMTPPDEVVVVVVAPRTVVEEEVAEEEVEEEMKVEEVHKPEEE